MSSDSNKVNFKLNRIIIIIFLVLVLLSIMLIGSFNKGINQTRNSKNIETYESIPDLIKNSSLARGLNLEIPDFLSEMTENNDELQIRIVLNSIIEIGYSDKYVLKVSSFVNNKADTLGLYEKSKIDNQYTAENDNKNEVKFFRYRVGYPVYPNCTIINWCTDNTSYGLILGNIYSEQEIANLIMGDSLENLNMIPLEESAITNSESETQVYDIGNLFTVELPKFESQSITQNDLDGFTTFYINKILCFVFVYNDYDIDTKTFEGQSELKINNSISLYYRNENPFEVNTPEFRDYEKLISSLKNIKASIIIK